MIRKQYLLKAVLILLCLSSFSIAQKKIDDLRPTVILVAIDGFRADYLELHKPKHLNALANSGVRAKWMTPSFPSKTFPNHYTIATGLLPAHHGIIENNMYDAGFDAVFGLSKREEVSNPRWWFGEPIWVTAEKQGQKSAAFFFPGTETPIGGVRPSRWRPYDGDVPNKIRTQTVLSWLDVPVESRPTMFTLYFSDVDDAGHRYSPEDKKTREAVHRVDKEIGRLVQGLKKRGIQERVNLIVVSDHGMTPVPPHNRIVLDEMFDESDAKRVFWVGEFIQIIPLEGREDTIYDSIKSKLPPQAQIYRRSEIPGRYRLSGSERVAPIVVLPDEGWVLTTRKRFEEMKSGERATQTGGSHGYDNELVSMRALFVANGPAFKKNFLAEPFSNVEVYNLMCRILGLEPAPNDGDFRNVESLLNK